MFQSKASKEILYGIGATIIILLIFQAGIFVGYHKAAFSYQWGDNYYRTFEGMRKDPGFARDFIRGDFPDAHGTVGKIIKIDLPTIFVTDQRNIEKAVVVKDDTVIRRFRETLQPADLKVDDFVVVIGSPNEKGQVEAKFIRLTQ
jgi:hypothetical protein